MFTGKAVKRFGVRGLLAVGMPLCGLSYAMLAMAPGNQAVIMISAIVFVVSSIAPGNGFLVWGISLFRDRPSARTGAAFVVLSLATIAGPIPVGLFSRRIDLLSVLYIIAILSVLTIPLSPRRIFGTEETVA